MTRYRPQPKRTLTLRVHLGPSPKTPFVDSTFELDSTCPRLVRCAHVFLLACTQIFFGAVSAKECAKRVETIKAQKTTKMSANELQRKHQESAKQYG